MVTVGAGSFILGILSLADMAEAASDRFGFDPVGANSADTVAVPGGYQWQAAFKWGDPLWSDAPEFDEATRGTGAGQERALGDSNDSTAVFGIGARQALVANNEYTNLCHICGNRVSGRTETEDDIRKGKTAHDVAVPEIAEQDGQWSIGEDSPLNRRITAGEPMQLTSPAAGHLRPLQTLRHRLRGCRLWLAQVRSALRHLETPERAEPRWLRGRDRPVRSEVRAKKLTALGRVYRRPVDQRRALSRRIHRRPAWRVAGADARNHRSRQGEICIHTRQAASIVGATTMDRPEWVTANPTRADVYVALTNNKNRGIKPNAGGDATPVGGPDPREANHCGRILRWTPDRQDHTASGFGWDIFALAGNPEVHEDAYGGPATINADNMFNAPTVSVSTLRACRGFRPTSIIPTKRISPEWATTRC